jgi:hypothetical protein
LHHQDDVRDEQPWDEETRDKNEGQPLHERAGEGGVKAGEKALVERSHDHGKEKVGDAEDVPGGEEWVADKVFVRRQSQDDPWGED